MMIDKDKLKQDIAFMKEKLASMEQELAGYKHFPSKGDTYTFHYPSGHIDSCYAQDNRVRPYTYKTVEEAINAYNKAVAVEKVKRRVIELQGEWLPDWTDAEEEKFSIRYDHSEGWFRTDCWYTIEQTTLIPYMESEEITKTIMCEYHSELKIIFDIKKD